MRSWMIAGMFAVLLLASRVNAVLIGFFPGLEKMVRDADAIVILRVDKTISDFEGRDLYTTHDCFIYQTLKGTIPTNKIIRLQLMDTRFSFESPYSILSTHLMFLTKKRTTDEPTEYRTIEVMGANMLVTPFGQEKMPEGKTIEDKIRSVLKRTLEHNRTKYEKEKNFIEEMIKGTAEQKGGRDGDKPRRSP